MMSFKTVVILSAMFVVALANKECEEKAGITWEETQKEIKNPSEKALCLMKCLYESDGVLNKEGKIVEAKLAEKIDEWIKMSGKDKAAVQECLKTLKPVVACADVTPMNMCIWRK